MISQSLLMVGMIIYILAWLLPAFEHRDEMFGTTSVSVHQGWEAFWFALRPDKFSFGDILNSLSALTNFPLTATLVATILTGHRPHLGFQITLIACALLNLNWWFRVGSGSLRIGYYWWAGSFFLIGAGFVPWHGTTAPWTTEGIVQSALLLMSLSGFVVGILVEWRRISDDTKARKQTAPNSGASDTKGPKPAADEHDEPQGVVPVRRGSQWFLVAGVVAACMTWFLLSLAPKTPAVDHPVPGLSRPVSTPHRSSSIPADGLAKTPDDSGISPQETPASSAVSAPAVPTTAKETSPIDLALQQQARDLRRKLAPFLNDPSMREEALKAEKSLGEGEDLLRRGDAQSAADRLNDASSRLNVVRASAQRILGVKRLADQNARNAMAARQRFTRNQALEYAEGSYSRGEQLEARAGSAYRSRDYRSASSLYASAYREYDNAFETIRNEEQLQAAREQQAREAARRLQEEQARELAKRQAEEREQRLRAHNALRAKATGKIHKVQLNFVTYGGGHFPELEILVDFSVSGMQGVDGDLIVFLESQQVGGLFDRGQGPFEPLKGSGSDSNGVYAHAKYTPPYDSSQYSKVRLAIRTSRFTLPKGSNRIRASVYLRTGSAGTLVRDLDGASEDILLNQP